jgi:hypothetical protein
VLGVLALSKQGSAQQQPNIDQAEAMQGDAVSLAHGANWAFVIGGALAAVGLAWVGVDLLRTPSSQVGVSVVVNGNGIGVSGVFR